MPDTHKSGGKDVHGEQMQEIDSREGHLLMHSIVAIVLVVVCDHALGRDLFDARVADGN